MTKIVESLLGASEDPAETTAKEEPTASEPTNKDDSEATLSPSDAAEMRSSGVFWVGIGVALIAIIVILVVILLFCSDTSTGGSSSYRSTKGGGRKSASAKASSNKNSKKSSNKHKSGAPGKSSKSAKK